ncbi:MAG: hypothetical protein EBQ96_08135 [Proteobacteria bacterium]|nr:hypothetical protein [Pseudomonadota bacterium]
MFRFALVLAVLAASIWGVPANAQVTPKPFTVSAFAVDAKTLAGGGMMISLWGIDALTAPGTMENTRARIALDDIVGDKPIRCMPMSTPANGSLRAQCLSGQERDLALHLLSTGMVSAKRSDLVGSDLANAYLSAERNARAQNLGLWGGMAASATVATSSGFDMTGILGAGIPSWAIAGGLLLVPMLGFLMMALIMHSGFRQLIALQKYQLAGTQKRERQLKEREKYVIASALEGELHTNRAKLDAFLTIYEELLKSLRDPSKKPKYQRAGDIIHEKPALSRTVYDSHIDKLDILGPQLSTELANLYANIEASPDYKTLEPELPIEKARETVDKIIKSATKMADPMDKMIGALAVIVRDKRGASATE